MLPPDENEAPQPLSPLTQFSPSLDNFFRALFGSDTPAFDRMHNLFNYCFLNGGREDPLMPRAEDESYNPRLARLALLVSEGGQKSETALGAALLVAIDPKQRDTAPADQAIKRLAAAVTDQRQPATPESQAISLALHLDRVRHLHQTNRDATESRAVLSAARALLEQPLAQAQSNKLKTMLAHAISQQERRCTR